MSKVVRNVRGAGVRSTLLSAVTASVPGDGGQFAVQNTTGWPTTNFVVVVDRGLATQEKILVASRTATICTVGTSGRAFDGSTAQAHPTAATVEPIADAALFTALLEHVNTDAGKDHAKYLQVANKGLVGDLTSVKMGDTALAGSTGRWTPGDHRHAYPNPPAFRLEPTSIRSTSTAAASRVLWDVALYDNLTGWAAGANSSRYTMPVGYDGWWLLSTVVHFAANTAGYREVRFYQNGVQQHAARFLPIVTAGIDHKCHLDVVQRVNANDYWEVFALQTSGGALNLDATDTHFEGHWLGPA